MDSASSGGFNWGLVVLLACTAAGLVYGLRFFFRQNHQDLDILKGTLESDSDDEDDEKRM